MGKRRQKPEERIVMRWFLRRGDQLVIASILVMAVLSGAAYFGIQKMRSIDYIDIDQAPAVEYRFLVDVNQAEWAELAQLPGIGETLAKRIVQSREMQGPFLDHSDLQRVKGIGPRTVETLRSYLLPMPKAEAIASDASAVPAS
ncbi:ComEA family DNA-binding protein [Bremerella sp. P1]|uniref:ComEA family DNA-binding protein n=1 Tax=Bremerella sp. P1 TaxID=3026424 RepID=UPI002368B3EE|nr:helix-hairpin-helix domain-containing protein [Bremerella sp. P1]WDI42474.1 helix-hairpin-helix domain-containing protein [Bremerella sp. P1]